MTKKRCSPTTPPGSIEPLRTIPQAARQLGLPVSTLRRAVNAGLVPTYHPFSSRARVRLSEVTAAIDAHGEMVK